MNAKVVKENELSNETLLALFEAKGLQPELDDEAGEVLVHTNRGRTLGVSVEFAAVPDRDELPLIRFERRTRIRDDVDDDSRNAFCDRINSAQGILTAFTSREDTLCLRSMLPAASGIGGDTLYRALSWFVEVCDAYDQFDGDHLLDLPT